MYQLTQNPDQIIRLDDGANIPRDHRWWGDYEVWLAAGNTPQPAPDTRASDARSKRDGLIAASDWTQMPDAPLPDATKALWATYRTALRGVPQQAGFPSVIEWPTAP